MTVSGNADDVSVGQRVIVIEAPIDPTLAGTVSDGLVAAVRLMDGTRHITGATLYITEIDPR